MTTHLRHSPVDRQLEAYRESWKADHDAAMRCRDWEEILSVGLSIHRLLRLREEDWRDRVFRGSIPFEAADDREHQERLRRWLDVTRLILRVVPELEHRFGTVEVAEQLRRSASDAEQSLDSWQPPRLSAAVGLREMTISSEAAAQLDRLAEEVKNQPPVPPPGQPIKTVDASFFKTAT